MENNKNIRDQYMKDSLQLDQSYASLDAPLQVSDQVQILANGVPEASNVNAHQLVYLIVPSQEGQSENLGDVPSMVLLPGINQISGQQQHYYIPNCSKPVVTPPANGSQVKVSGSNSGTNLYTQLLTEKPMPPLHLPPQHAVSVQPKQVETATTKPPSNQCPEKNDQSKPAFPNQYGIRCDYPGCNLSFSSLYKKKIHTEIHLFPASSSFKCAICNMLFETALARNKHIDSHTIVDTFKCKSCAKSFPYYVSLVKHAEEKKCVGLFRCFICDVHFASETDLEQHRKTNVRYCSCRAMFCGEEAFGIHTSTCLAYKRGSNSSSANGHTKKKPQK